jgi:hypothetical protein
VDEHVGHPEERDPEPLWREDTWKGQVRWRHVSTDIRCAK